MKPEFNLAVEFSTGPRLLRVGATASALAWGYAKAEAATLAVGCAEVMAGKCIDVGGTGD